jgi:ribosomal protein L1
MAKKRTTMDALSLSDTPEPPPEQVTEMQKQRVSDNKPRLIKQTLYLPEAVHEQLRVLAFHERVKQHDLLMAGLDMMFKSRGAKSISELRESDE